MKKKEISEKNFALNYSRAKRPVYLSKEEAISTCEKVQTPNTARLTCLKQHDQPLPGALAEIFRRMKGKRQKSRA